MGTSKSNSNVQPAMGSSDLPNPRAAISQTSGRLSQSEIESLREDNRKAGSLARELIRAEKAKDG
jgi:hypothetical protein